VIQWYYNTTQVDVTASIYESTIPPLQRKGHAAAVAEKL
jgi:hypothetical protein